MRVRMFVLLMVPFGLVPIARAASDAESVLVRPLVQSTPGAPARKWRFEALLQAHSVAGPASPWAGVSVSDRVLSHLDLGLRGFVPTSATVDKSTYALQVYSRFLLNPNGAAQIFLEPAYAMNFYEFQRFASYGLAVGALTALTPDVGVGFSGGIELASVVLDSFGLEQESSLVIYPKVALISNISF